MYVISNCYIVPMHFRFTPDVPNGFHEQDVNIISGNDSLQFDNYEYLVCRKDSTITNVFRINYEYHCSPFKEALLIDDILAVGHEQHFYLYNLQTNTNILRLKVDGYFGHLYHHNGLLYIADACGIHCMDKAGKLFWANDNLAIDGVTIHKFEQDKIYVSGEWDPPGGWRNAILDLATGKIIS